MGLLASSVFIKMSSALQKWPVNGNYRNSNLDILKSIVFLFRFDIKMFTTRVRQQVMLLRWQSSGCGGEASFESMTA